MGMVALAGRLSLSELLRFQDGLIRRDQAFVAALARSAVDGHLRRARWQRVLPTVYLTEAPASDRGSGLGVRQFIRAVWMWAGDAVITGSAAAAWAGHLDELTLPIRVTIPASRRLCRQPGVLVVRGTLDRRDISTLHGILITKAIRTATDLAAEGCNDLLHRMAQRNRLSSDELQSVLDRGAHRRGWATARAAVRECATNPHSEAERVTHRMLAVAGIWGWRANAELVIEGRTFRPDLTFDEVMLIVEIDGFTYHGDRDAFERDRDRQNRLTAAGWTVLRFTWRQIHDHPEAVIARIEETLGLLRSRIPR